MHEGRPAEQDLAARLRASIASRGAERRRFGPLQIILCAAIVAILFGLFAVMRTPTPVHQAAISEPAPTANVDATVQARVDATVRAVTPTAVQPTATIPTSTAMATPNRGALMARLDAAWSSGDWNATVVAAATLRNAYPNDAEAIEKFRAANINAGDAAARSGMKPAAIIYYDDALHAGWDADTAAKRLAVVATPTPTARPATATPVEAPKAPLGTVGQWQLQGGMALLVVRVARLNQLDRYSIPKRGNVFVDVEVAIRNMNRDEVSYNPYHFSIRDANGFEYDQAWGSLEPSLKSGTLQRGEQVRGSVAFEVAATARGLMLLYDPVAIFGSPDMMRFDLGQ